MSPVLRRFSRFLPALALVLSAAAQAAPPRLEFEDVAEAERAVLLPLLQHYLSLETPRDAVERDALARRLRQQGSALLATEGYFDTHLSLGGALDALVVTVRPGARTRVESVTLEFRGALSPEREAALREGWALPVGQAFRQTDWDRAKEQLLLGLMEKDFPAASITESEALIEADTQRARLRLSARSGAPYRFGALEIQGLERYPASLVQRYNASVLPGRPYTTADLLALQSTLENTPYFTVVEVTPDLEAATREADGSRIAPIRVRLREEAPHRVGLGAGISSNTGLRLEGRLETADLFHHALQFSSGLRLEQRKQSFYADLFLPPPQGADPANPPLYALGFLTENSDIQDLRLKTLSLALTRRQNWRGADLTLALGYLAEWQRPKAQAETLTRALTLNSVWNWAGNFGAGRHTTQLQIGGAMRPISTRNFIRLYGREQIALPLSARNTLNLRLEGGINLADARKGIPQNFLFRAGGSNSVRGYAYQSLGVDEGKAILGGRYLLAASVEWIHWLPDSPWGVALFVDSGNAGDDKETFRLKTGYGIGARWNSPAGPLGIDLARGDQWRLHFAFSLPF
ncbi:MAG: BamA/TamA family outer membrane protein [Zoogloeaceae bacterium]|jgi:translocation and assembly module TamA|nr:BamA/TamA family outer membrane protein [Zoogloeaceae bacterium]